MDSIFTRIVNGEIPCHRVAESREHLAFLDINPIAKGHTLVIPKRQIDYVFDLDDALLSSTIRFARQVAKAMDAALNPIRTGLIVEGLEVPHAHFHLVPIYHAGQQVSLRAKIDASGLDMAAIASSIAAKMAPGPEFESESDPTGSSGSAGRAGSEGSEGSAP